MWMCIHLCMLNGGWRGQRVEGCHLGWKRPVEGAVWTGTGVPRCRGACPGQVVTVRSYFWGYGGTFGGPGPGAIEPTMGDTSSSSQWSSPVFIPAVWASVPITSELKNELDKARLYY